MKRGAARGSSRSSALPSCSDVAQPELVGSHQKKVSVADFLLRNKSLADQLTVSDFDTATAEIVAAENCFRGRNLRLLLLFNRSAPRVLFSVQAVQQGLKKLLCGRRSVV